MLDNFKRYQKGYKLKEMFPINIDGLCACGCEKKLVGKQKKWASEKCAEVAYNYFSIIKGNNTMIRKALYNLDNGYCRNCGVYDKLWEADHITPVFMGGGLSDITNFQTLCVNCHKEKSKIQIESHRKEISSQAASIDRIVLLKDFGELV